MVTTSASGLDPDITVANARAQAPRVAAARGMSVAAVLALVDKHTAGRAARVPRRADGQRAAAQPGARRGAGRREPLMSGADAASTPPARRGDAGRAVRPARRCATAGATRSSSATRPASARPSPCWPRPSAAASAAKTSSSASSRRTAARPPPSSPRVCRQCPRKQLEYRGKTFEEMDTAAVIARKPEWRPGRRARPHQYPGHGPREALAERRGDPGRRHRRDLHGQRAALREPERHDLPDHRRAGARDAARLDPRPGRRGRARRPHHRRAHQPPEPRRRLRPRQDPGRPQQLLPARQPRGAARARPAQDRRRGRREASRTTSTSTRSRRPGPPKTAWSSASRPGRSPRSSCAAATAWPSACRATSGSCTCTRRARRLGRHHDELAELFELARNLGGNVVELSRRLRSRRHPEFARETRATFIVMGQSQALAQRRRSCAARR